MGFLLNNAISNKTQNNSIPNKVIICFLLFTQFSFVFGQDNRAQLNPFLQKGYVNVNFGYIDYPYANEHLGVGYTAAEINRPHFAARIMLGSQINKYLAVQYSIMRAAIWPSYKFKEGDDIQHLSVWVNEWGLTLKGRLPLSEKNSVFLESGLGILSRNGFEANSGAMVKDANYFTLLSGTGFQHAFNSKFDGIISATYSPRNRKNNQPYTIFASAGIVYHLHAVPDAVVAENEDIHNFFPKQFIQVGGASNFVGYKTNDLFSMSGDFNKVPPMFWRGVIQTETDFAINYQRNVFHTKKSFSLDWGASVSYCQTEKKREQFIALSVFPVLRFWWLRTSLADMYFVYSVVGPTYISKVNLDDRNTGTNFTFQDFMGIGTFLGKNKKLNAEIKIEHYSNGNYFAQNPGIDLPLMLNFGYAF